MCIRVGECGGKLYLDLCDGQGHIVEIGQSGWEVVTDGPIPFVRTEAMLPLPVPTTGGRIEALQAFINIASGEDFVLAVSWLLACFRPIGPYPVLLISGGQGSAKSTVAKMLSDLVDPSRAALRSLPGKEQDLFIAASNCHVLAFDNVSAISDGQSDALCRIATGGSFATRQLYTNDEETTFSVRRPMMLNGIGEIVSRPDLADRALSLTLTPISDDVRQTESDLWAMFEQAKPAVLGALLDAIVQGLRALPTTKVKGAHRMADAFQWAVACGSQIFPGSDVQDACSKNCDELTGQVLASDPVAGALRDFMQHRSEWCGTSGALLDALTQAASAWTRSRAWPQGPKALSNSIERSKPALRQMGIHVQRTRSPGKKRERLIHIENLSVDTAPAASN